VVHFGNHADGLPPDDVLGVNVTQGASFPASPSGGDLHYKSDVTNPEWFYYDSASTYWLSVRTYPFVYSHNNLAANAYLYEGAWGPVGSATAGTVLAWDMVCTEVLGQKVSAANALVLRVRNNGGNTAAGLSLIASAIQGHQTGLAVLWSAGAVLSVYGQTSGAGRVTCTVVMRRREA
jgi:hypothetical protein